MQLPSIPSIERVRGIIGLAVAAILVSLALALIASQAEARTVVPQIRSAGAGVLSYPTQLMASAESYYRARRR